MTITLITGASKEHRVREHQRDELMTGQSRPPCWPALRRSQRESGPPTRPRGWDGDSRPRRAMASRCADVKRREFGYSVDHYCGLDYNSGHEDDEPGGGQGAILCLGR
jgi:hypothetical protein